MSEFYGQVRDLMFANVDDLYLRRESISKKYEILDYDTKEIYKWFFYFQLCLLKNPLKRLLWEYINDRNVDEELGKEYLKFCDKRNKIYK